MTSIKTCLLNRRSILTILYAIEMLFIIPSGNYTVQELTGFRRDILYTLLGMEDPIGSEINDVLENRYQKTVYHGRLYDNLDSLIERGFVEKMEVDGRTNCYQITEEGEQVLFDHREWQRSFVPQRKQQITAD